MRLLGSLAFGAFLLGAWGMLQWFGHFSYGSAGDVGVRAGVALTSGGVGQLQGGEFAYPVAIIGCAAVLAYGNVRSLFWRTLLLVSLALNAASCLVTFERSFWLATIVGLTFVLLFTSRGDRRLKVLAITAAAAAVALIGPVGLRPGDPDHRASAAQLDRRLRQRLVGAISRGRIAVRRRADPGPPDRRLRPGRDHLLGPAVGAGAASTRNFSHDGYLWLAWKIGDPRRRARWWC